MSSTSKPQAAAARSWRDALDERGEAMDQYDRPANARSDPRFSRLKRQPGSEIFTKLDNVKSRICWTVERRLQLQQMWERGDKTSDIAIALGCKVGAVSVARARFGLKRRRIVSGRPREPDEPAHKIERVAFITSRLMEFCTEKELVAQTGHESYQWPCVIAKELVDNGLDICEETGIAPVIKVIIKIGKRGKLTRIIVEDNGPGFPDRTVAAIIDYSVRVSSREAYISPTRGRQGNALKTILPMAYVLSGGAKGETWIESRGLKHRLVFSVNQIKQEPIVRHIRSRSRIRIGTRITVFWPADHAPVDPGAITDLLTQFAWVNPHLSLKFVIDGKTKVRCEASNPDWTKYRACDATSAHWYRPEQIERYAGALIARDQESRRTCKKFTVREFIAQFRGLSASEKQKDVLRALNASHMSLHRFFGSQDRVNRQQMKKLLHLLQEHTRPVRPELLGIIGSEHFKCRCLMIGGEPESFKYFSSTAHNADGLPYVLEIATCAYKGWVAGKEPVPTRTLITGVNFSATLNNPFDSLRGMEGMNEILVDLRAGPYAPVIVCVHYACPHIEYLDRGKSRIGLE